MSADLSSVQSRIGQIQAQLSMLSPPPAAPSSPSSTGFATALAAAGAPGADPAVTGSAAPTGPAGPPPPGTPAGSLSAVQVARYAYDAGFRGQDLVAMTAIAMRESGGRPAAFNGNLATGDQSYGLWQINMIGPMGSSRLQQFGISSAQQLFDPAVNAHAAFSLYSARRSMGQDGLYDWGGYKGVADTFSTDVASARVAVQQMLAGLGTPAAVEVQPAPAALRNAP